MPTDPMRRYTGRSPGVTRVMLLGTLLGWTASAAGMPFPADAVVDMTRPPYSAVPDDAQDDTAALQQAITDHLGTGRTLFLPRGTYLISRPLEWRDASGRWRPRLTLRGESREGTILRLADSTSAFADAARPAAVINTGSLEQEGDAPDGGGNKAFGNYILDLTVDTGAGNPGAVGIEWATSNFGAIEGVTIRSGDGAGAAGIAMKRRIPGPGLIRRVAIDGFEVGIDVDDLQYGVTLDEVTLTDQRVAGVRTSHNLLHIHDLTSRNQGPAIVVSGRSGVLTLVRARLTGGAAGVTAIQSAGAVFLRDVEARGYGKTVEARADSVLDSRALLTAEPAPGLEDPDPSTWQAVGARMPGETDDTAAIQRAIDSGRSVVYFRNDRVYFISDTIVVRGAVRHIHGFGAELSLGAAKAAFSDVDHPRPLIRIDPTDHGAVHFEHLFFNAQYPGEVIFENNTPADVVIRHCAGWVGANGHRRSYHNTDRATGRLFVEDVFLPGWHIRGQSTWARQFNPENLDGDGVAPQVLNDGGRLWILGFKTEGPAPFIVTRGGGITELLGAYNYLSATHAPAVPSGAVPYVVDHATASLTFTTENFRDSDYRIYVRHRNEDRVREWAAGDLPPRDGRPTDRSRVAPLLRLKGREILWSRDLDHPGDLAGTTGAGVIAGVGDRTALHFHKPDAAGSTLRSFVLPVEELRGRWVHLEADVKAAGVGVGPNAWNGIKVMLKIDTPGGTQWPQIPCPAGSFDFSCRTTRVLIPPDATAIELILGLELVAGDAWIDNARIALAKEYAVLPPAPADQPIYKGHDGTALRGAMVHPRVTREDLRVLAEDWGGNLIRYQLLHMPKRENEGDLEAYEKWIAGELDYLDGVLAWSEELGLRVVVDLHSPPGGPLGEHGTVNASGPFWSRPDAQARFVATWQRIAERYKGRDVIWGFDLLNEPDDRDVRDGCEDWQALAGRAARAIRAIDPERTLIVEPPGWGGPQGFAGFLPLDVPRVVYSFHLYAPHAYTHQHLHAPGVPVPYPGRVGDRMWDRAAIAADLRPALDFAARYRVHLYVGEFSAIRWAPGAEQYLADLAGLFNEYGWDWTYHAFREWQGWDLELSADRNDLARTGAPGPRLRVLREALAFGRPGPPQGRQRTGD